MPFQFTAEQEGLLTAARDALRGHGVQSSADGGSYDRRLGDLYTGAFASVVPGRTFLHDDHRYQILKNDLSSLTSLLGEDNPLLLGEYDQFDINDLLRREVDYFLLPIPRGSSHAVSRQYVRISRDDLRLYRDDMVRAAQNLHIPVPKLHLVNSDNINAAAVSPPGHKLVGGRAEEWAVEVTSRSFSELSRGGLAFIAGHELGHVNDGMAGHVGIRDLWAQGMGLPFHRLRYMPKHLSDRLDRYLSKACNLANESRADHDSVVIAMRHIPHAAQYAEEAFRRILTLTLAENPQHARHLYRDECVPGQGCHPSIQHRIDAVRELSVPAASSNQWASSARAGPNRQ
jgi:hypothetical protein